MMTKGIEPRVSRALRMVVEHDTRDTRAHLYDALQHHRLILPLAEKPKNLEAAADGRVIRFPDLDFFVTENARVGRILDLFTAPQCMDKWKENVPTWIAIDTPTLCRLALKFKISRVRIDFGSHLSVQLAHPEIENLAARDAGEAT